MDEFVLFVKVVLRVGTESAAVPLVLVMLLPVKLRNADELVEDVTLSETVVALRWVVLVVLDLLMAVLLDDTVVLVVLVVLTVVTFVVVVVVFDEAVEFVTLLTVGMPLVELDDKVVGGVGAIVGRLELVGVGSVVGCIAGEFVGEGTTT